MSAQEGEIWLVEAGCWANRKVALRLDEGWSHVNGVNVDGDGIVTPVRPLVVIDLPPGALAGWPTLINALELAKEKTGLGMVFGGLIEQIKRQTEDVREPTDPKARVTDRRENIWRLLADGDWVCTSGPDVGEYLVWWQLAERGPLTVEGVTP